MTPPSPPATQLAVERERIIARLQDAVAADQLDLDELDARLDAAIRARTAGELLPLVADLPVAAAAPTTAMSPTIRALFSATTRRGRRTLPREVHARAVFGSVTLDLREATFQPGVTTLTCQAVFGSVEVLAPPHVRVEVEGSGIFGAFEERGDNSAAAGSSDAPILIIKGRAVFGSVEAVVKRQRTRRAIEAR